MNAALVDRHGLDGVASPNEVTLEIAVLSSQQQLTPEFGGGLARELSDAGADSVEVRRGGDAPAGSKGVGIDSALLIEVAKVTLPSVLAVLASWITRHPGARVRVKRRNAQQEIEIECDAGEVERLFELASSPQGAPAPSSNN